MITCDRCLEKNIKKLAVIFKKYDGKNRQGRTMLKVPIDLCDACIDDFLEQFGHFKVKFLKEGD